MSNPVVQMITRQLKAVLWLILIIFTITFTVIVFNKSDNADIIKDSIHMSATKKNELPKEVRKDDKSETSEVSGPDANTSNTPDSSPNPNPKLDSSFSELVDKVLKSDEDLEVLVELGMIDEFRAYFNIKQLKKFNLSVEMEKAVAEELKRICREISSSDRKSRKWLKNEYKKTIEEKKKQFEAECRKEPNKKATLKGKRVKISENSNELRFYELNSGTKEFFN